MSKKGVLAPVLFARRSPPQYHFYLASPLFFVDLIKNTRNQVEVIAVCFEICSVFNLIL